MKNSLGTHLIGPKLTKNFWIAHQKNLVPRMLTCSVTAKMFEHQNSGRNRGKESNNFGKFTQGILGLDLGKKNSKLSQACVP